MLKTEPQILYGIAEDVKTDGLKLGRVKVRIFNYHSEQKQIAGERGIPTEDLPWAIPMIPTTEGSMTGIGTMSKIVQGSELILLARDELKQDLIIIGVIPGIHQMPAKTDEGFYDPEGMYPLVDRLQEPDTHRLSRGEKFEETILADKVERVNKNIPMAFDGDWSEPFPVDYVKPEYPFNKVTETESGHHFERDDTEGFERLHTWHKSGAFDEITFEGERIIKTKSNFYVTVEENHFCLYVKEGGIHFHCKEDFTVKAGGLFAVETEKGIKMMTLGDMDIDVAGSYDLDSTKIRSNT